MVWSDVVGWAHCLFNVFGEAGDGAGLGGRAGRGEITITTGFSDWLGFEVPQWCRPLMFARRKFWLTCQWIAQVVASLLSQ